MGDDKRRGVRVASHLRREPGAQFGDFRSVRRLIGEIGQLVRVGAEVEKLCAIHERVADEFVALVAERALHLAVGKHQRRAGGRGGVAQCGAEVEAFTVFGIPVP